MLFDGVFDCIYTKNLYTKTKQAKLKRNVSLNVFSFSRILKNIDAVYICSGLSIEQQNKQETQKNQKPNKQTKKPKRTQNPSELNFFVYLKKPTAYLTWGHRQ